MKVRSFLLSLAVFSSLGAMNFAYAEGAPIHASTVSGNGLTHFSAVGGGIQVAVDITTHVQPASGLVKGRVTACTGSRHPCSLVDRIDVHVGTRVILVPKSAIIRLADAYSAGIKFTKNGQFEIFIKCGDASEAYTSHMIFDRSRMIEQDIFADEAGMTSERTLYSDLSHAFDN